MEQEIKIKTSTREPEMMAPLLTDGLCPAGNRRCMPDIFGKAGLINPEMHNVYFADNNHLEFYAEQADKLNPDCYLKALIYTLGLCPDTRRRFDSLYDAKNKTIVPEAIHFAWQTSGSLKATRLAFQLFTNGTPSAFLSSGKPDFDECVRYSVSDIFCCGYAPYFVEAIKLRYPEYMRKGMEV